LHASLDRQAQATAGLPEQLHRARLQVMQSIGPQEADSSRVLREMAAGALRRWGLLRQLQTLMSEREQATETLSLGDCLLRLSLSWMIEQPRKTALIVDQAVECAKRIAPKRAHYTNALLRRFGRERESLIERAQASDEAIWNVPGWWLALLRKAFPDDWQQALKAAAQPAPVSLRVNRQRVSVADLAAALADQGYPAKCFAASPGYPREHVRGRQAQPEPAPEAKLYTRDALYLHPATDPRHLPGFSEGLFTVQDLAAQQAAWLMDLSDGMPVLDACAAPGGKTGHMLELADCDMHAWDVSAKRLERLAENLNRLQFQAQLACVDLLGNAKLPAPEAFFERILLDAPCSASGIIGRHPEIRWRRQEDALSEHQAQQIAMLCRLWPLLKPGGLLLFVTCSIFPQEGEIPVQAFLAQHQDAHLEPLMGLSPLLPSCDESLQHDGFYFARLRKRSP
jgi:16S rRNA (cytosine967-C5)-methyltransferase